MFVQNMDFQSIWVSSRIITICAVYKFFLMIVQNMVLKINFILGNIITLQTTEGLTCIDYFIFNCFLYGTYLVLQRFFIIIHGENIYLPKNVLMAEMETIVERYQNRIIFVVCCCITFWNPSSYESNIVSEMQYGGTHISEVQKMHLFQYIFLSRGAAGMNVIPRPGSCIVGRLPT